ncbi:hypothetical protein SASPL_115545 [Salvia splendens]|uniref:Uncharacterized protein n=1 Tax=Salvia splendens TaxID=180675 RepID=A0A8X8Y2P7_SALSN|nr:uncharacterized protein LOC121804236 [Salvia splendens]KAG6425121.1 hypothetical protein SASPL_115545 [Salvia splendens]
MNKKASQQQSLFVFIITTPYRALCKARDFYVKSMLNCANSNAIGLQSSVQPGPALPRSFSATMSSSRSRRDDDVDYRELVRAASARTIGGRVDLDAYVKQERKAKPGRRALPSRSASVAMGRIDEERPTGYFGEDIKIGNINKFDNSKIVDRKCELKYPRSKSHAAVRTALL